MCGVGIAWCGTGTGRVRDTGRRIAMMRAARIGEADITWPLLEVSAVRNFIIATQVAFSGPPRLGRLVHSLPYSTPHDSE